MDTFKIYLAGSMSNVSFEESNIWRMVAKEWLENCECRYHVYITNPNDYYNFLEVKHTTGKEIIRFDLNKVRNSDLVLANLNHDSTGTAMEIQHAFDRGIPIIGYVDDEFNVQIHPWLEFECDRVFVGLQAALNYIENYYLN